MKIRVLLMLFILLFGCNSEVSPVPPKQGDSTANDPVINSNNSKTANEPLKKQVDLNKEEKSQLLALGYITSKKIEKKDLHKDGVTTNIKESTFKGINVYCSENSNELNFMNMDGKIVHRISVKNIDAPKKNNQCKTASFDSKGNLVMVFEKTALVKLNLRGDELWRIEGKYHHDVEIGQDGTIYGLRTNSRSIVLKGIKSYIIDESIVEISKYGKIESETSVFDLAQTVPSIIKQIEKDLEYSIDKDGKDRHHFDKKKKDIFHLNTIEIINRDIKIANKPLFKKGQLLLCSRHLNTIMVVDLKKQAIIWNWGMDELQGPHNPSMLKDGSIMVFDNGLIRKKSRVLTVSPSTGKITHSYDGGASNHFFSKTRGSVQLLKNDNMLICDSEKGHVFEVDVKGNIIWEFWNPERRKHRKKRVTIFKFDRLDPKTETFLSELSSVSQLH